MKYAIFYLLEGKAKKYNEKLMKETAKISGERYILDVSKFPSHVSLKNSFEFDNFNKLDNFLKDFVKKHKKAKININGFDNFRKFISFLKTNFSKDAKKLQKDLIKELDKKLGIKPTENELKYKPHATICYGNTKETFNIIWNYLQKQKKPKFNLKLDNLTLFYKPKDRWIVRKRYEIK